MVTLKEFFEAIQYKVTDGYEYQWQCFGPYAQAIGSDTENGSALNVLFDTRDQTVYEVQAWDMGETRFYRWMNPTYVSAYQAECDKRGMRHHEASDEKDFIELETASDILEKVTAIAAGLPYDTRVEVPLTMPKDELHQLMLLAHRADMTLNDYVVDILTKAAELTVKDNE